MTNQKLSAFIELSLIRFFLIGIASWAFFFNRYNLNKIKKQRDAENDILKRELQCVKEQFNLHLTHNFLNFCYYHIQKICEKTSNSIESYSNMLLYTLKRNSLEKVQLQHEIEYILNYIEIQKLLNSEARILFTIKGDPLNKLIIPFILISITEDAFSKYEIKKFKIALNIDLEVFDDCLVFKLVVNSLKSNNAVNYTNSIIDIKKNLEVFYKDKHILAIYDNHNTYNFSLILDHIK